MQVLGTKVSRTTYSRLVDVIGEVEQTASGNVVLRIGRETETNGPWESKAHVVLTKPEARELAAELLRLGAE